MSDTFLGGRPFVKRFASAIRPLSVLLWRWCIVAKRLDGSWCTWYGDRPRPRLHFGAQPP